MKPTHHKTLSSSDHASAEKIQNDLKQQHESVLNRPPLLQHEVCKSTMVIPEQYTEEILSYCCDPEIMQQLEQKKVINWFENARTFVPMWCENDGNSMLHATCLYVFGVHDRNLTLRNLVYQLLFMEKEGAGALFRRWQCDHQNLVKQIMSSKSSFYQEEFSKAWDYMKFACSTDPGQKKRFCDLEPVHIFAIANILGRPVVVVANTLCPSSDAEAVQGLRFEGIYLPLLRNHSDCEKSPIVLAYECGQFVPLFSTEKAGMLLTRSIQTLDTAQHCILLQKYDTSQLPVRYLLEEEKPKKQGYLRAYIDTFLAPYRGQNLEAASIKFKAPSAHAIELLWAFQEEMTKQSMQFLPKQQFSDSSQQYLPLQQNPAAQTPQRSVAPHHQQQQQQQYLLKQQFSPSSHYPPLQQNPPAQAPQRFVAPQLQQQQHQLAYQEIDEEEQHQYALVSDLSLQSRQPCERSKVGKCQNLASFQNDRNYCDKCYEEYTNVRKQTRKRTTLPVPQQQQPTQQQRQIQKQKIQQPQPIQQQPPRQQQQVQEPFQCHLQQPQWDQQNPHYFQQQFNSNSNYQQQQQQQQQQPSIPQSQKLLCRTCGKNKAIPDLNNQCKDCYDKSMYQSYEATRQSLAKNYEFMTPHIPVINKGPTGHKDDGIYESMHIPSNEQKNQDFFCYGCDKTVCEEVNDFGLCADCNDKIKKKQSDLEEKKTVGVAAAAKHEPVAAAYGGHSESLAIGGEELHHQYDRNKVLCSLPGCNERICEGSNDKCEKHKVKKLLEKCLVCNKNPAEDNDFGTCITCYQSQGNIYDEFKMKAQMEAKKATNGNYPHRQSHEQQENFNIGRGPVGNTGIPRENSIPLGGLGNMDDVMESLPPLPPPTQTRFPNYQQQQQQQQQFRPPAVYQGYTGNDVRHGDAALNWQKGKVPHHNQQQMSKCSHCDLPANPHKSGLCDDCFAGKQNIMNSQQQQLQWESQHYAQPPDQHYTQQLPQFYAQQPSQQPLVECVNGCKSPGRAEKNYLCDKCFDEQLRNYQTNVEPQGQIQNLDPLPCATRGCTRSADAPSKLCRNCQGGNYSLPVAAAKIGEVAGGAGGADRSDCLSLDCEFFGSPEFGGYCSSCLMEITKAEAEKKKQVGIQSYIPEELVMDLNGRGPVSPVHSNSAFNSDIPFNPNTFQPARAKGFTMNPVEIGHGVNQDAGRMCKNPSCEMFGNEEWGGLCSSCFKANVVERDGGVT